MAQAALAATVDPELVARLATALTQTHGVAGAVIADSDGGYAGGQSAADPVREAALAAFVFSRSMSLTGDGDLRGMGRLLIGSQLMKVTLSGPSGEYLVMPYGDGAAFVTTARGVSPELLAQAVTTTLRRYS